MKILTLTTIAFLMLVFSVGLAYAEPEIPIQVSPNVINLQSEGTWVTVHANIPYSEVAIASLSLNGIPYDATKYDNRGDLVVKFYLENVKDYLDGLVLGDIELTLSGLTEDAVPFFGSDTITLIDQTGKK